MKRPLPFVALALLVLALAAFQCPGFTISIGATPTPLPPTPTNTPLPPTPTPVPTDTPVPPTPTPTFGGEIVFEEDFSDNRNGWFEYGPDEQGNEIFVGDGVYNLYVVFDPDIPDQFFFGGPDIKAFDEFGLGVEATLVSGTDFNQILVFFGYQDNNNFYYFAYGADGFVMLGRLVDGQFEFIEEWQETDAVIQGEATNSVGIAVVQGFFAAVINGETVLTTELPDYIGGNIGLGCGPFEEPDVFCTFDNLTVYA